MVFLGDLLHQVANGALGQVDGTVVVVRLLLSAAESNIEARNWNGVSDVSRTTSLGGQTYSAWAAVPLGACM